LSDAKRIKTGGRKPGTPNKDSNRIRLRLDELGFDPIASLVANLSRIEDPTAYHAALLSIMPYIHPKLKDTADSDEAAPAPSMTLSEVLNKIENL